MSTLEKKRIPGTEMFILADMVAENREYKEGKITLAEYCKRIEEKRRSASLYGISCSVGGSDTSTILGLSPWNLPSELAKKLRKQLAGTNKEETNSWEQEFLFFRGHAFEDSIKEVFAFVIQHEHPELAIKVEDFPYQIVNENWPHCIANVDGIVWEIGKPGILEIKTTDAFSSTAKDFFEYGEVPEYYMSQVQFYMQVLNMDFAYIVCSKDLSRKGVTYIRINRDEDYGKYIMDKAEEFVEKVIKGLPIDDSCVKNESLIKKKVDELVGDGDPLLPELTLKESYGELMEQYFMLAEQKKEVSDSYKEKRSEEAKIKKQLEGIEREIALAMAENTAGKLIYGGKEYHIEFPAADQSKPGPGAMNVLKDKYTDVYEALCLECPNSRKIKLSQVTIQKEAV